MLYNVQILQGLSTGITLLENVFPLGLKSHRTFSILLFLAIYLRRNKSKDTKYIYCSMILQKYLEQHPTLARIGNN